MKSANIKITFGCNVQIFTTRRAAMAFISKLLDNDVEFIVTHTLKGE